MLRACAFLQGKLKSLRAFLKQGISPTGQKVFRSSLSVQSRRNSKLEVWNLKLGLKLILISAGYVVDQTLFAKSRPTIIA